MKYKIIKEYPERQWLVGDILQADELNAQKLLSEGFIEEYTGDEPNKHVIINVEPVQLSGIGII